MFSTAAAADVVLQRLAVRRMTGIAPQGRRFSSADAAREWRFGPGRLVDYVGPGYDLKVPLNEGMSSPRALLACWRVRTTLCAHHRLFVLCRSYEAAESTGSCSVTTANASSTAVVAVCLICLPTRPRQITPWDRCCWCCRHVGGER